MHDKLHLIRKPFFFLSNLDDPCFGYQIVPIGQRHEFVMLGTLGFGGHCCNIEGGLLPTGSWWTKPALAFNDYFMKEAAAAEKN